MCGRFAQYRSMRDYLRELDSEQDAMSGWKGEPIQRYNVAPSTQVQVLHSTGGHLVVAEVRWGWAPNWARGKMPPPINAQLEKVATGNFFRNIWPHRALVATDGWFEWPPANQAAGSIRNQGAELIKPAKEQDNQDVKNVISPKPARLSELLTNLNGTNLSKVLLTRISLKHYLSEHLIPLAYARCFAPLRQLPAAALYKQ